MRDQKVERLGQALFDKLAVRLANAAYPAPVLKKYDTNGDLYLEVTTTAHLDAVIKFEPEPAPRSGQYDSLGLSQVVYNPHVLKVGFDTGVPASATATIVTAVATNKVTINGHDIVAVANGAIADQWNVGVDDNASAANLAAAINASVTAGIAGLVTATAALNVVTITAVQPGPTGNLITFTRTGAPITVTGAGFLAGGDSAPATTGLLRFQILLEVAKFGTRVDLYEASGITVAKLVAANLIGCMRDLEWGILAQN